MLFAVGKTALQITVEGRMKVNCVAFQSIAIMLILIVILSIQTRVGHRVVPSNCNNSTV